MLNNSDTSGVCEWCKVESATLQPHKDRDEGMAGTMYDVCRACIRKENKDAEAELESYDAMDEDGVVVDVPECNADMWTDTLRSCAIGCHTTPLSPGVLDHLSGGRFSAIFGNDNERKQS